MHTFDEQLTSREFLPTSCPLSFMRTACDDVCGHVASCRFVHGTCLRVCVLPRRGKRLRAIKARPFRNPVATRPESALVPRRCVSGLRSRLACCCHVDHFRWSLRPFANRSLCCALNVCVSVLPRRRTSSRVGDVRNLSRDEARVRLRASPRRESALTPCLLLPVRTARCRLRP